MKQKDSEDGVGYGVGRGCKGEEHATRSLYGHELFPPHQFPEAHKIAGNGNSIDVLSVPCPSVVRILFSTSELLRIDSVYQVKPTNSLDGASGQTFCQASSIGRHYAD